MSELKGIAVGQERLKGVCCAEVYIGVEDTAVNEHRFSDVDEGIQRFFATLDAVERVLGVYVSERLAETDVELLQVTHVRSNSVLYEVFKRVVIFFSAGD